MNIDVSLHTGFDLVLDTVTLEFPVSSGFIYKRIARTAGALQSVLRSPGAVSGDTEMYHIYYVEDASPAAKEKLERDHLTYSPVLLPPRAVGGEFVKTSGHYHPPIPGSSFSYPEIYTGLYGRLLLFLQKRDLNNPDTPADCTLIDLTPGVSVTIPPEYAHVLINPTDDFALMAGLYSIDFKPEYDEVQRHRGLAYYIMQGNGDFKAAPNPLYWNPPPLKRLHDLKGTIFAPPDDPTLPLWTSFSENPERYAFLARPDAVARYFANFH